MTAMDRVLHERTRADLTTTLAKHCITYFGGTLSIPTVLLFDHFHDPATKVPIWAGYSRVESCGFVIVTHELLNERTPAQVSDSLLHELVHHAYAEDTEADYQNHGAGFVAIANRIAKALGLGEVAADSREAELWPQTLRG